jgi:ABC-type oligopeptide transport system substrate-binding subunit
VSADGTVCTFKLRQSTWSDGLPISAQAFVDSWLRTLDPDTASPYAWMIGMVVEGADAYLSGDSGPEAVRTRALDEYAFEMRMVGPLLRLNMFLAGEADRLAGGIPTAQLQAMKLRDDFQITPALATFFLELNHTEPLPDEMRVRKALAVAFDTELFIEQVARGVHTSTLASTRCCRKPPACPPDPGARQGSERRRTS